jgi:hypothetical protein
MKTRLYAGERHSDEGSNRGNEPGDHKSKLLVKSETGEVLNPGFSVAFAKPSFQSEHSDFESPENDLGDEEAGQCYTQYVSERENVHR